MPWRRGYLLLPAGRSLVFTLSYCFLITVCLLGNPVKGFAQGASDLEGLRHGARDSARLDLRLSEEERAEKDRVGDQRIGGEERRIRMEMKQEELLRSQEQASLKKTRQRKDDDDLQAAREREDGRIHHKKKKYEFR